MSELLGKQIVVYERTYHLKYKRLGTGKVIAVTDKFITVDYGKYKNTISILNLRADEVRIYDLQANRIFFKALPNVMKIEKENLKKVMEDYREQVKNKKKAVDNTMSNAIKLDKATVIELYVNQKLTPEQIVEKTGQKLLNVKGALARMGLIEKKAKQEKQTKIEKHEVKKTTLLAPKVLIGESTEYEVCISEIGIKDKVLGHEITIPRGNINKFIAELQELAQLVGA